MSMMKLALERRSIELGHGGVIHQEVIDNTGPQDLIRIGRQLWTEIDEAITRGHRTASTTTPRTETPT